MSIDASRILDCWMILKCQMNNRKPRTYLTGGCLMQREDAQLLNNSFSSFVKLAKAVHTCT
jgi:hypothetical protein